MAGKRYPPEFVRRLKAVRGKRARIVVEHILEHGYLTSEELQRDYGYEHPPRAVRDVREQGILIETFSVESSQGKTIAAYRFGEVGSLRPGKLSGRRALPKALKEALIADSGSRCAICLAEYEPRYLQVDHRVPFEVAGNSRAGQPDPAEFMLLCRSCNRAKSWSCEHCPNSSEERLPEVCRKCYLAEPDSYDRTKAGHGRQRSPGHRECDGCLSSRERPSRPRNSKISGGWESLCSRGEDQIKEEIKWMISD